MEQTFTRADLGRTGLTTCRLGLSATYWPGKKALYCAIDRGINFFFAYGFDRQMVKTLRDVFKNRRDELILATGAYNLLVGHLDLRRTLEKRLRQFGTDHIGIFLFLGVTKEKHLPPRLIDELCALRDEGKVSAVGLSCHDRQFAGRLAADGRLNAFMIRYNAAHRGAEEDIFPHLDKHDPAVISYTATRWRYLLKRQKNWPDDKPIPTAEQCYRFVLSNPHVDVCLTAPSNMKQLQENLRALDSGPLTGDEMAFMKDYGDLVHHTKKWFM